MLASQFDAGEDAPARQKGSKPLTVIGLCFADVFAGLFFLLLAGFGVVLAAALSFGVAAVCLLGGVNVYGLLPAMPYWCGAVLGLSLLALAVLSAVGCVCYAAFLRQLICSFGRFQHNALANASGEATLPVYYLALAAFVLLTIRGFFRKNAKQYRRFSAAQAA